MVEEFVLWKDSTLFRIPAIFGHKFVFSVFLFIIVSLGVLLFQYNNTPALGVLKDYITIKNNIGNWVDNVTRAQDNERARNENILLRTGTSLYEWGCHDAGAYYIPFRLNKNRLQESIRRGAGDAWKIQKSNGYDPAALQFCQYVISNRSNEVITCGLDAFEKTGTGGLFESTHWCSKDWNDYVARRRWARQSYQSYQSPRQR